MEKQSKAKKILSIIGNVVIVIFFVLSAFLVGATITSKKSGEDAVTIFGHQARIVETNSMEKCELTDTSDFEIKDIPVGSLVFIDTVPNEQKAKDQFYASLKKGDVLTFYYTYVKQVVITHRIVEKNVEEGGYEIILEGDNKNSDNSTLRQVIHTGDENSTNYVIGKVVGQSKFLGGLMKVMKSKVGLICLIIVPCAAIFIYEIIKIVSIVQKDKHEKTARAIAERDNELEVLRNRLKELEEKGDGTE